MPETIIESVLTGKLDAALLLKWLNNESIEDTREDCVLFCCNRRDFVAHFLSYLRNQTDSILQTNSNAAQILHNSTPEKVLSSRRKHHRSISDPTSNERNDSLTVKSDRQRSHESPSKDRKRSGRRIKTKLFPDDRNNSTQSISSDESRLSIGVERIALSSTPLKNGTRISDYPNIASPVTPKSFKDYERCDTPRVSHRHSRSQEKSCLGDYIVNAPKSSKKKKTKNTSNETDDSKPELDLSNSDMFPEIGTRKASSLRSERRRIKPTNIDKSQKSISLNSFTSEFQQPSLALDDNVAFKQQKIQPKECNSFEVERNILKQERHKLMEKFNILNTSNSPKPVPMPQIKITQKDSVDKCVNYVKIDPNMIVFKEKIDMLVDIYNALFKNNLILSVNTEIYFLISILISKQCEDDYLAVEGKLKEDNYDFLLKSIHNSTYFAVKSLWIQKSILEVILDKNSLKTLGENKKVRSIYPELAKSLLNSYGLKCEAESHERPREVTNGVVCFNMETDNVDNFPSMMSFQNFKKQRDMFYDIHRWYQESQCSGGSLSTLRARVKSLVSCGSSPTNHGHMAALFVAHIIAECLPNNAQESKLSKLQRRLTCPNAPESHRLPHFTDKETFYKDFITHAENEGFRVHLKDALSAEIIALDSTHIATEDRGNPNPDISREYLQLIKKLGILAKFLGFTTALPYIQVQTDNRNCIIPRPEQKEPYFIVPKVKVLENGIAVRDHTQPTLNIKEILSNSYKNGRLSITLPWVVHYLSMLDYTSLRIQYYQELLKTLFEIYENRLKFSSNIKKNTVIYLKSILGWLFDLPQFPQDLFYENRMMTEVSIENSIDSCDLVDDSAIFELCPSLKDVNLLLSTSRITQERKENSYRHITPVSLGLNSEDRIKNKEKEIQARLEDQLLRSQPPSSRRILEVVTERVSGVCVRSLGGLVGISRGAARAAARNVLVNMHGEPMTVLTQTVRAIYESHYNALHAEALAKIEDMAKIRAAKALEALLPSVGSQPLVALCVRACMARGRRWLAAHWSDASILCKDFESETRLILALCEVGVEAGSQVKPDVSAMLLTQSQFEENHISPATCIIGLKEQICLLLEDSEPDLSILTQCAFCCRPTNIFLRPSTLQALCQLCVDLCVVYVSRKPLEVTDTFLLMLHEVWNTCCPDRKKAPPQELTLPERREDLSPTFRNFEDDRIPTPVSDDEAKPTLKPEVIIKTEVTNKPEVNNETKVTVSEQSIEFFDRLLCPRNIVLLSDSKCKPSAVWESMASVLVFLLKNDYLSEDSLTEQCLAVYRQDWPQNILESLSTCMKAVSARWSRSSTGKFTLFLDFLAEFCGDMDYEPME